MAERPPHSGSREPPAPIPLPVARRTPPVSIASSAGGMPAPANSAFALSFGIEELGPRGRGVPVLGGLSAIFGVAALFQAPVVLGPLAIFLAVAALFRGQAGLAAIGGISAVVALAISPVFWAVLGVAWLGSWLLG